MAYDLNSCLKLLEPPERVRLTSLDVLSRSPLDELLHDANVIQGNRKIFESDCFRKFGVDEFAFHKSTILLSLLKLAVALEMKNVRDAEAEGLIARFTPDERQKLRDLEKFDVLEPQNTPPSNLAELIVSESGAVYSLVAEAIGKQYVDFSSIIQTWSNELRISPEISKAFQVVYQGRFRNVVDAIKLLLDQQPAWLRRLFREYEQELLASAEVRKRFEEGIREKFVAEAEVVNTKLADLEGERARLADSVRSLEMALYEARMGKEVKEEKLSEISSEYEKLKDSYYGIWSNWESKLKELDEMRKQLDGKEKELEIMAAKEKEGSVARLTLETEVERLRGAVGGYEMKMTEYEYTKTRLNLEMGVLQERQSFIERALRGEIKGRLVEAVDCKAFERSYIPKFEYNMMELPKTFETPWGPEKVSRWDGGGPVIATEGQEKEDLPRNMRMVFTSTKKSLLGLGGEKSLTIEVVFKAHLDNLGLKKMDERPLTMSEVLSLIPSPSSGMGKQHFHVLGVASPTGFEEKAVNFVSGSQELPSTFVAKNFGLFLIDPLTGEIHRNKSDARLNRYEGFFVAVTPPELEAKVLRTVRDYYSKAWAENPGFPYLSVRKAPEVTGASPEVCLRILHRLAAKGCGSIERREIGREGEAVQVFRYLKTPDDPSWGL